MKTIEQKAKAYDEAVERAKTSFESANGMILKKWLVGIFPELAESEDERVIKGIKSLLKWNKEQGNVALPYPFVTNDEALAWLEKQGENLKQENYKTTICGKDYKCIKNYKVGNCSYSKGNVYHCGRDGYLIDDNGISWSCNATWCKEHLDKL